MRIYELIFICKPDLPEEEVDVQVQMVRDVIESDGGTVSKVEKWGKKKLAYKVQKFDHGYYVLVEYSIEDKLGVPKEIERRLGVAEPVIKFMTIRIDEEIKRADKLRLKREKRLARKPAPAPRPAPPKPSAPEAPGAPAASEEESAAPAPAPAEAPAAAVETETKPDATAAVAEAETKPESEESTS